MEQVNKFLGYRTKLLLFPSGTRVAIYNRVSTEKLAQLEAIEHQVIESRQIVEESGLELAFQYIETESGTSIKNREYYQQMLTDMANDKFDILMIKSQDRMMRDQAEWHLLKRAINKYHKILYFYMDDEIFNQKENGMKHDVQAMLDEYESEKKSSKAIHSHNRRQTTYEGQDCLNITRPVYGWDRNVELDSRGHKKIWFTVNEKEAENIREVCRLVEEGKGFYTIANIMYGNGVLSKPTYGTKPQLPHKISGTAWKKVIRSPLLHGDAVFNKEKTDFYTKDRQKVPQDQWIYRENDCPCPYRRCFHLRGDSGTAGRVGQAGNSSYSGAGSQFVSGCGCGNAKGIHPAGRDTDGDPHPHGGQNTGSGTGTAGRTGEAPCHHDYFSFGGTYCGAGGTAADGLSGSHTGGSGVQGKLAGGKNRDRNPSGHCRESAGGRHYQDCTGDCGRISGGHLCPVEAVR